MSVIYLFKLIKRRGFLLIFIDNFVFIMYFIGFFFSMKYEYMYIIDKKYFYYIFKGWLDGKGKYKYLVNKWLDN